MIAPADVPRFSPHEPAVAPDGQPLRLALVNDYELVVAGLAAVLAPYGDRVQVVEFDVDDDESQPVDIAVYDTFAAPRGGSAQVGHLLDSAKVGKVVAYSFTEDESAVRDTLAIGVHGYISKAVPTARLVDALEKIAAGEHAVVLSDAVDPLPETEWPGKDIDLTEREAEVIGLIAQGYSNEEIARMCYLSINTVKTYIRSAYRKAGVNTRAQAVAWALRHGFRPERTPSL